ncbi:MULTISPECIES: hypothetical protein [Myxococcaceae]|nr:MULTISPECIES: hypothetical protein [Myxococcaceae]
MHPSSILRAPDEAARREAHAAFLEDLRVVAHVLTRLGAGEGTDARQGV